MTLYSATTQPDPRGAREWSFADEVIQLREWGTDRVHPLPPEPYGEWLVGASPSSAIHLVDSPRLVSREHALLFRGYGGWVLRDAGSKNGLWIDNARRSVVALSPGLEIGIGSFKLIADSVGLLALRALLARLIGWKPESRVVVDNALLAVRAMAELRAPLVLTGDGNLVEVAREIHERVFGVDQPFMVSDPRRRDSRNTSRSAEGRRTLRDALEAARGGTVCVWASRLPADFDESAKLATHQRWARLVICYRQPEQPALTFSNVIGLPSLSRRADELDRIIDEYAEVVTTRLSPSRAELTPEIRSWIKSRRPQSVAEIARTVERVLALHALGGTGAAAEWLGISRVALATWLTRRRYTG